MPRGEADLEARVIELETRILFLEEELSKLSRVLAEEAERSAGFQRDLARFAARLQEPGDQDDG